MEPKYFKKVYGIAKVISVLFIPVGILCMFLLTIEDRIIVTGSIESGMNDILRSPLEETLVDKIFVKPGDDIKKDEPIVQFQDLRNWRFELDKKRKKLEIVEEKANVYEKLRRQGAESTLSAKTLRNDANMLKIEIKSLEEQVKRLTLRAPYSGRITEVMITPFQNVDIGSPVVALSGMDEKVIRCDVPEKSFFLLQDGQQVAIKSNQFNYYLFGIYKGVVKSFIKYASHDGHRPVYETTIKLIGKAEEALKIGSTAQCEIIVEKRPLYTLFLEKKK